MRISRHERAVRGSVAAVLATFVALVTHLAAGGEMPGPVGIIVPLSLALPVSLAVVGRRVAILRTSIAVVASQALFHTLFSLGTQPMALHTGHAHAAAALVPAPHAVHSTPPPDAAMLVAHALAALVTIAYLRAGDAVLARIPAVVDRWLERCTRAAVGLPAAPRLVVVHLAPTLIARRVAHAHPGRAPPAR